MYHNPVMLHESVDGLNIKPNGIYVDVTFGGGGHSREILKRLGKNGRLIAFDQDEDALKNAIDDKRFLLLNNNFRYLKNFLKYHKAFPVDGILADLGVSSHQFDIAERGFSTRFDSELDMRMNQKQELSARSIVNEYDQQRLSQVFWHYGEIDNGGPLASGIISFRKDREIKTTADLKEAIAKQIDKRNEVKYLAKVFQALRIEANMEMEVLKEFLKQGLEVLKPKGRLVVISYHSLEDRLVKNFFKSGNFEGEIEKDFFGNMKVPFGLVTKKALIPNEEEINENSRARSAKLRIAEKY
jgi:16S rRNA (cytosine1402-N4)-methyltransferase